MGNLLDLAGGLVPGSQHLSVAFVALLLVHVPGLTCVAAGAVAAASRKRRGRQPA